MLDAEKLVVDIQEAAWKHYAQTTRTAKGINYPGEICDLISQKSKTSKKWQQTTSPDI